MSMDRVRQAIPLWVKLAYTLFTAVLVPVYWHHYGPLNFLYFCDVALLLGGPMLWFENRLLASILAVVILLPQTLWIVDFLATCIYWPTHVVLKRLTTRAAISREGFVE